MHDDDLPPDFRESPIPGLATMLAALEAGDMAHAAARNAYIRGRTGAPFIAAAPGTPLARLREFSPAQLAEIRAAARARGVTADMVAGQPRRATEGLGSDSKYFPRANRIDIRSGSMPEMMHELGHATPIAGSHGLRQAWQGMATQLSSGLAGKALRGLLVANIIAPAGPDDRGPRAFAAANAPLLVAATYAPELIEEARATVNAMRSGGRPGLSLATAAKELLPGLRANAIYAAGPILGTLLTQKVVQALRDRQATKTAAATAGKEVQAPGALRASASSAWQMGAGMPKPKSTSPGAVGKAKSVPAARPPSKRAFFADVVKSLNDPQRGFRQAKPEG